MTECARLVKRADRGLANRAPEGVSRPDQFPGRTGVRVSAGTPRDLSGRHAAQSRPEAGVAVVTLAGSLRIPPSLYRSSARATLAQLGSQRRSANVMTMARIVVLLMGGAEAQQAEIVALEAAGHDVVVVEPRFPECKRKLDGDRPALVIVDGRRSPSHGRAAAGWMASVARFRTVPFLFLDVADKDVARVKKEVPRAQFATWASVAGASERLVHES